MGCWKGTYTLLGPSPCSFARNLVPKAWAPASRSGDSYIGIASLCSLAHRIFIPALLDSEVRGRENETHTKAPTSLQGYAVLASSTSFNFSSP